MDGMAAQAEHGVSTRSIIWQERERTARLFVPSGYDPAVPAALVVVLHGGGGTAERMANISRFDDEAERRGFLVVYPNGVLGNNAQNWNDGRSTPGYYPADNNIDDVGFIAAMLDRLALEFSVDPARIYATGISNGGFMAYRLACDLADRFAAVAPVAATITAPTCAPSAPVSVLHLHGTADRYVPFEGGVGVTRTPGYRLMPVRDAIDFWRRHNGCASGPDVTEVGTAEEPVTRETWQNCDGAIEVTLYTIQDGGHTWPGGPRVDVAIPGTSLPSLGMTSSVVRATPLIAEFFAAHPRQ
jgi:polyhydroxybutyrate depolymerase